MIKKEEDQKKDNQFLGNPLAVAQGAAGCVVAADIYTMESLVAKNGVPLIPVAGAAVPVSSFLLMKSHVKKCANETEVCPNSKDGGIIEKVDNKKT